MKEKVGIMNQASNASGTTRSTLLDDIISETSDLGDLCNGLTSGTATPSICSRSSQRSDDQVVYNIYNYKSREFESVNHSTHPYCENICIYFCRKLHILPATCLLFGIRSFDNEKEWIAPNSLLHMGKRYCFRLRFRVASLDTHLRSLDPEAYEYLYNQMRFDMVRELIPEIRYPTKKDNVMGLGMVDMYIDHLERADSVENIEKNYKKYLPRELIKAHKMFVKSKICRSFEQFLNKNIDLDCLKWTYIHEINTLAPNYLTETFEAVVEYIPDDDESNLYPSRDLKIPVLVKIDLEDNFDLKVCKRTGDHKALQWILLAKLESFYHISTKGTNWVDLEVTGLPNPYRMNFERTTDLISFITYLSGYYRLTTNWNMNLSKLYAAPSLIELKQLHCHGPIGGTFSFNKIREKQDECGSYIIRQCEKEYDVYYIDINTKPSANRREKNKTETFKIKRDRTNNKWILHINDKFVSFPNLNELVQSIPTESLKKFRIKPSNYDKAAMLLICLPKKIKTQLMSTEINEKELQRKRVQILHPKTDLQWYKNSHQCCDHGKIMKVRADWIQDGKFKEIPVTLKVLRSNADFADFMKLVDSWSSIYSPQFIKLYGLTLSTPYTMVMENAKYGPLNELLSRFKDKISTLSLLGVVHGLVRGITDLQKEEIFHGYIRCSNLYVTKFDLNANVLEAKIGDPGIQRPYTNEDLAWIPLQYYNDLQKAKNDYTTDHWAFATTVWEIFSRGATITGLRAETFLSNYMENGAILPVPIDCPEEMIRTIMDGWWSRELDKPFNQQEIFERLSFVKQRLLYNYESLQGDGENLSTSESYSNMCSSEMFLKNSTEETKLFSDHVISNNSIADHTQNQISQFRSNQFRQYRNYFDEIPSVILIPNGKLIYKKKIGEGHYGTVYLGEIQRDSSSRTNEKVAIKTLKSLNYPHLNDDFKREIQIMESLNHPNIVGIKRWIEKPLSIIMEYVEGGSFLVYLTIRKPNLKDCHLLKFALNIAEGMDYLRSKEIIHRDLAARNILVDSDSDCAKISDFGLAQKANSQGYYIAQNQRDIPIKWYSPESIKTGKFSFQHDVWSFGVTLFEMFSRGEEPNLLPNQNISKEDFLNRLEKGERLKKPESCPDKIYKELMMPCWNVNPKSRPSFKDLIGKIQSIIESDEIV